MDDARKAANLRSLQRLDPTISDILGTATHVVVYQFNTSLQKWEKSNMEGSLFIVKLRPGQSGVAQSHVCSLMILNRADVDNMNIPITPTFQMQLRDPYLIFRDDHDFSYGDASPTVVRGIWFHDDQERSLISALLNRVVQFTVKNSSTIRGATASGGAAASVQVQSTSNANTGADNRNRSTSAPPQSVAINNPVKPSSSTSSAAAQAQAQALLSPMALLGLSSTTSQQQTASSISAVGGGGGGSMNNMEMNMKYAADIEQLQLQQQQGASGGEVVATADASSDNNVSQTTDAAPLLDKKNLQLALLSLIQDDRFLDLIHAQYLKVATARGDKK